MNTTEIPSTTLGIQLTTQKENVTEITEIIEITEIDEFSSTTANKIEITTEEQSFVIDHEVEIWNKLR